VDRANIKLDLPEVVPVQKKVSWLCAWLNTCSYSDHHGKTENQLGICIRSLGEGWLGKMKGESCAGVCVCVCVCVCLWVIVCVCVCVCVCLGLFHTLWEPCGVRTAVSKLLECSEALA